MADQGVLDDPARIDDETRAECALILGVQDVVGPASRALGVTQKGVVDSTQLPGPGQVRLRRVDASAQDLTATRAELRQQLLKTRDFGGTNKREVGRIEEQNEPAASEVGKAVALRLAFANADQIERSGGRADGQHDR